MQVIEDVFAETDHFVSEKDNRIRSWWFAVGHTVNGGRFYSEPFELFDDACSYYDDLKELVKYFGGGHVELLRISDYDYDVVAISRI